MRTAFKHHWPRSIQPHVNFALNHQSCIDFVLTSNTEKSLHFEILDPKTRITTTIKLTTSNMQRCNLQHATSNLQQTLSHLPKNLQVARNGAESGPGWVRRCLGDS